MESVPPPQETKVQSIFALTGQQAPRGAAILEWDDDAGAHRMVLDERAVIGSAPGSGVVLDDDLVSRLHAELDPRVDGVWIRDLGSRNGTYVDGMLVREARLPPNARLSVGGTTIRVTHETHGKSIDLWPDNRFGHLLGRSPTMRALFAQLARVAQVDSSVLIHGETGTGKELVARALHDASPRARGPFVVVDCAALPENLLDAELFGHTKGAFTGAESARIGAIEAANEGTVFLDEVGELPLSMQPKLLRVIESRTVRRVGETTHRPVDVRFVSATHRDLLRMVSAGEFREDLYFRLAVVPVNVPSLAQRVEDIELLVEHFLGKASPRPSPELLRVLERRPWRGNVRELRNFVHRAEALGTEEALALASPAEDQSNGPSSAPMSVSGRRPTPAPPSGGQIAFDFDQPFRDFRERWIDYGEREYVRRVLEGHDRNVAAAAQQAQVDRTYIYRLIKKHAL